jgi:molybdopterin molybdotransferase
MWSLAEARTRILEGALPGEAIEVPLPEAVGLVLAEPAFGDVDQPPFDRAAFDGYALRATDTAQGVPHRLIARRRGQGCGEVEVGPGRAVRVGAGDPMPVGADAVLRTEDSHPEPAAGAGAGPPRLVKALRPVKPGANVVPRGERLRAGTLLAPAGTRLGLSLVGLLAAQGCVHPVCHRRARVAVLAVGDELVGAGDAPVMHRERNAAGPAVVAPCVLWGATAHDLGAVVERELDAALDRALTAPVVVILGPPAGRVARALNRAGVEPVFSSLALKPVQHLSYGIVPAARSTGLGPALHHVFHLSSSPIAALTTATLLFGPLIARLHGATAASVHQPRAILAGPHRATDTRTWAVPVTLADDDQGRRVATLVDLDGQDDLVGFARAEALALLPPLSGPWHGGEVVEIAQFGPSAAVA